MNTSGWIILDKPSGITSRRAGGIVARMLGAKTFGHIGTLDPMASGLLPIAMGGATKVIPYMDGDNKKEYLFSVQWGFETDTLDIMGTVVNRETVNSEPTSEQINAACAELVGEIDQVPPQYSAIHVGGRRAYDLARRGQSVEIPARKITIYELDYQGDNTFRVVCSTGTYVRSLAKQIAEQINHKSEIINHKYLVTVDMIRRVKTNGFEIKNAVPLDFLENLYNNDQRSVSGYLEPIDVKLGDIPVWNLDSNDAKLFQNGGFIGIGNQESGIGLRRIYQDDKFIGIGEIESGVLKPKRVI